MRRLISKSMRKWIVGGCVAFGGAAIATTGFATWIVGTQITNANTQPSITVDTAVNESVSLEVELGTDNSIHLSENIARNTNDEHQIVFTEDGQNPDFKIEFKTITINCGKSYWENEFAIKNSDTGIYEAKDFTLDVAFNYSYQLKESELNTIQDLTPNNKVITSGENKGVYLQNVDRKVLGPNEYYTYIDLADNSIKVNAKSDDAVNWKEEKGYMELVLTNVPVLFTWGSFFHRYLDGASTPVKYSPAEFYNQLSKEGLVYSVGDVANVFNEFEAMTKAFQAKDDLKPVINLTVSL